ncbi:DUF3012 domain-containing protein [Neiella sp. HB171785]|uniref:DUF3012 domain-containing protein n=1 Tax=Neiella litorisoli TaxID=2771431 RepID=A0A8J6QSK0_9GAMM|nr:DUF3012 domain-containing protein [Neiella litorisoli]MBD1389989.1 DUF3012 domain-containing protein [Neiella litorisoli]
MKPIRYSVAACLLMLLQACCGDVGSPQWCDKQAQTDKTLWTESEAQDYAQYCIFGDLARPK